MPGGNSRTGLDAVRDRRIPLSLPGNRAICYREQYQSPSGDYRSRPGDTERGLP